MDFLKEHLPNMLAWIFGAGGLLSAISERRKRKVDLLKAETESKQQIMDMYQEALSDLKTRYDEKFKELSDEIKGLKEQVNTWKVKYQRLKKEFDDYRKNHEKS